MDGKTLEEFQAAEKARQASLTWYEALGESVWNLLWRIGRFISEIPSQIKWDWQVLTKGYCDCDLWNLDSFIVRKVRAPLKEFIRHQEERGMSLPMDFSNDPAAWLAVLKKIEFSFDEAWKDQNGEWPYHGMTDEQMTEYGKKIQEGWELFGKYAMNLWD